MQVAKRRAGYLMFGVERRSKWGIFMGSLPNQQSSVQQILSTSIRAYSQTFPLAFFLKKKTPPYEKNLAL